MSDRRASDASPPPARGARGRRGSIDMLRGSDAAALSDAAKSDGPPKGARQRERRTSIMPTKKTLQSDVSTDDAVEQLTYVQSLSTSFRGYSEEETGKACRVRILKTAIASSLSYSAPEQQ